MAVPPGHPLFGMGISVPRAEPAGAANGSRERSPRSGGLVELVKLVLGWVFQRELRLLPKLLVKGTHCQGWL